MSELLKEIQRWSTLVPGWQQDAIVRLFQNGELTAADDEDLYALLKVGRGIPDEKRRKPRSLTVDMVAPAQPPGQCIQLTAISDLRRVNALAEGKTIPFAAEGMTAIYGDNGTGKSGYARVMKKACRARDRDEPILPNANRHQALPAPAEATFTLLVDGVEVNVPWKDGTPSHDALGTFAIFDARCARSYIDEDGDTAYTPYGMDVLRGLAAACLRLKPMLDAELARTTTNLTAFAHLGGRPTAASRLITGLSAATKVEAIEMLATWSPEEEKQLATLKKVVAEPDPREKARQLRLRAGRLTALADRCASRAAVVGPAVVSALRKLVDNAKAARAVADLAAKRFTEQGRLPGTGGEVWVDLFAAARRFAAEAYPGKTFPALGPEAPCPLCQQPLREAHERLVAFDAFVSEEAEKTAQAKREEAKTAYLALTQTSLDVGLETALAEELDALDAVVGAQVAGLEPTLSARRENIKQACGGKLDWGQLAAMPADPAARMRALAKQDTDQAQVLDKLVDAKTAAQVRAQLAELDDRAVLAQVKQAVFDAVATMKRAAQLQVCDQDLRTYDITRKASELNQQIVTEALAKELAKEFEALGVADLQVSLRTVGQRGKTVFNLVLEKPGEQNPAAVLSEGEQRAVAIASFLADLNLSGSSAGIVFDDPVSSLDHLRRWNVVARLVAEAGKRQVIVLTHDLYFLCLLQQEAGIKGLPCRIQSLQRTPEGCGVAEDSIPFDGAKTSDRVKMLRRAQVDAAKLAKEGHADAAKRMIQSIYTDLRKAWERAIEEVLFNGAVVRFTEGVATQRLAAVEVSDDDFKAINAGMTRCSKFPHDGSAVANVPTPTAQELEQDIEALEQWRAATAKRNEGVRKRRDP